ncbi:hypothetical protein JOE40_001103 [Arthrobacter sp. PvP102]|uniref:hypothetical protein n=1 Tax=unclassified Arthrobacter TaxID=235627 RepID=UPI001AE95FEE|nr:MULTISPECIES: hypothetical protein [unclassified Arthrobacter]MBP1231459.1 hypothetical protein [Arthrobacter sp. PvP103]MBP1236594.1 hypothetical protein [Arthrobacter sp. PvP102]
MPSHPSWPSRRGGTLVAVLALFLSACGQPGPQSGPSSSVGPSSGMGSPACELITPEIAAKAAPGLVPVGQNTPDRPMGSKAYVCTYSSKSDKGLTALSVALISPASAADISKAKSTSDCSPVTGIGDFACLQWTGYFRGETGGASANVVLTAVRGTETLEMPYVASPPMAGSAVPDGDAMARALSQAAVDAGWGNGTALSVPAAPPVGPQATTNNAVCALISTDQVREAFGAKTQPQVLPREVSCRYTFGDLGTPGPDSLVFSVDVLEGAAPALAGPGIHGEPIDGVGDRASFTMSTESAGPKSLRPASDVPITILSVMVVRGQNLATFNAQVLISPTGPSAEQTKDQLINLVRGVEF